LQIRRTVPNWVSRNNGGLRNGWLRNTGTSQLCEKKGGI
jgi:hypothetical protein